MERGIACFYQPASAPVDGWYDRLEVMGEWLGGCVSLRTRPWLHDRIQQERWVYLGSYKLGEEAPPRLWYRARAPLS